MPDQVAPEVIKKRVHILGELERELAEQFYLSRITSSAVESVAGGHAGGRAHSDELDSPLLEVLADARIRNEAGLLRRFRSLVHAG